MCFMRLRKNRRYYSTTWAFWLLYRCAWSASLFASVFWADGTLTSNWAARMFYYAMSLFLHNAAWHRMSGQEGRERKVAIFLKMPYLRDTSTNWFLRWLTRFTGCSKSRVYFNRSFTELGDAIFQSIHSNGWDVFSPVQFMLIRCPGSPQMRDGCMWIYGSFLPVF